MTLHPELAAGDWARRSRKPDGLTKVVDTVEGEQHIRHIQRRCCSPSPHLPHQQRWVENRRQQK